MFGMVNDDGGDEGEKGAGKGMFGMMNGDGGDDTGKRGE